MATDPWPAELERYRAMREKENARRRLRRATDPEYRERVNAYQRAYYASHPEWRTYHRERQRRKRAAA